MPSLNLDLDYQSSPTPLEVEAPFRTISVHFKNREDMIAFSKLVNQHVTLHTKSIWYPKVERAQMADKRWVGG